MVNSPDPADQSDASASQDPSVIDAEIVQEAESVSEREAPRTVAASDDQKKPGKAGWLAALILVVFISGLFAAPFARTGMEYLGLSFPKSDAGRNTDITEYQLQSAALKSQVIDLSGSVKRLQEVLAQQLLQIEEAAKERQQLQSDIGILATSAGAAGNRGTSGPDSALYEAELTRLSNEIARLSTLQGTTNPEVATLKGTLALARAETVQLKTKVESLEAMMSSFQTGAVNTSPRGRLVLALGRLKDRARAGLAFGAELAGLKVDIAELPALDQQLLGAEFAILSRNGDGIQSYEELVRSFDDVARAVKMAQEKQDGGFLANLFTVRRIDGNATGVDAILLSAEKRLAAQDVQGAVEALSALEGEAAATSADWRAVTSAHVETIKAIDVMIRSVAGSGAPIGGSQ